MVRVVNIVSMVAVAVALAVVMSMVVVTVVGITMFDVLMNTFLNVVDMVGCGCGCRDSCGRMFCGKAQSCVVLMLCGRHLRYITILHHRWVKIYWWLINYQYIEC